jgi:small subunit ribosomal protein S16
LLSIRLKRMGQKHRPLYRLVVSDSRNRPTGTCVEEVGNYDPNQDPSSINLNLERIDYWLSVGAKPSSQVTNLIKIAREGSKSASS